MKPARQAAGSVMEPEPTSLDVQSLESFDAHPAIRAATDAVSQARAALVAAHDARADVERALQRAATGDEIRSAMRAKADVDADLVIAERMMDAATAELAEVRERVRAEVIEALRAGIAELARAEREAAQVMRDAVLARQAWRELAARLLGDTQVIVPPSPWSLELGQSSPQLTVKYDALYAR